MEENQDNDQLDYVPRVETRALDFIKKYGEYDGRGVKIAIFDSGVDFTAPGLLKTSQGLVKVIDAIDATGGGDVSMTKTVIPEGQDFIEGLSGKKLIINKEWNNPKNEWNLGLIPALKLIQSGSAPQREQLKLWQKHVLQKNSELKAKFPDSLKSLERLETDLKEEGFSVDCVVWHDGENYRAIVDTSDLDERESCFSNLTPLTDYSIENQYAVLGDVNLCTYSVNIYDEGKTLSIYYPGSHGTHCAGIASAYFGEDSPANGVAPGAQIVAIKIGDCRLGSMETHEGLERGLAACLKHKVDIISMSYGESDISAGGRFISQLHSLIRNHNIVFSTSAGNDGPALFTGGYPQPTLAPHFKVGALLTPALSSSSYAMRNPAPLMPFAFTSRGPSGQTGGLNANISAPGGAFTSVPRWMLTRNTLMNGTSMACPNVTGCVALLISGLKQKKEAYSPVSIQRAVFNSAKKLDGYNALDIGHGVFQVVDAFESHVEDDSKLPIVRCFSNGKDGIYVNDWPTNQCEVYRFRLSLGWPEGTSSETKASYLQVVKFDTTVPWLECSNSLTFNNKGAALEIKIDKSSQDLAKTGKHFGFVIASVEGRPLIYIPVSVVTPEKVENGLFVCTEKLDHGVPPIRRFIDVPSEATHYILSMKIVDVEEHPLICFQTNQNVSGKFNKADLDSLFQMVSKGQILTREFKCHKGMMEIATMIRHSSSGSVTLELSVQFCSYTLEGEFTENHKHGSPQFLSDALPQIFSIENRLNNSYRIFPSLEYELLTRSFRPSSSSKITLLPPRYNSIDDFLENGKPLYNVEVAYKFTVKGTGTVCCRTQLDEYHYAYKFQQFITLYSEQGRYLHAWGWGGQDHSGSYSLTKLEVGKTYVAKVVIRSNSEKALEDFQSAPLLVDFKIKKVTGVLSKSLLSSASFRRNLHGPGESTLICVDKIAIPEFAQPGDVLVGKLLLDKDDHKKLFYNSSVTIQSVKTTPKTSPAPGLEKSLEEKLKDKLEATHISYFQSLINSGKELKEYAELLEKSVKLFPDSLKMKQVVLRAQVEDILIIKAADDIINNVDQEAMAKHFGVILDKDDKNQVAENSTFVLSKTLLIEALLKKASVVDNPQEKEACLKIMKKWIEEKDVKLKLLLAKLYLSQEKTDQALVLLLDLLKEKSSDEKQVLEQIRAIVSKLGWSVWEELIARRIVLRFPPK